MFTHPLLSVKRRQPYLKLIGKTRCRAWWEVGKQTYVDSSGTGQRAYLAGDLIGYIGDLSGNGFHLKQANSSFQFTLSTTPLGGMFPCSKSDGADDYMATDSAIQAAQNGYIIMAYSLATALTANTLCSSGKSTNSLTFIKYRPRVAANTRRIEQRNEGDTADAINLTGVNVALDTPYIDAIGSTGSAFDGRNSSASSGITSLTKAVSTGADNGDWGGDCTGLTQFSVCAHVGTTVSQWLECYWWGGCILEPDISEYDLVKCINYWRFDKFQRHI